MAIVDMKKLTLVGYGKDESSILRNLEKTGCVEIQRSGILEKTFTREEAGNRETVNGNLMRLQFVFDFLKSEERSAKNVKKAEKQTKLPFPKKINSTIPRKRKNCSIPFSALHSRIFTRLPVAKTRLCRKSEGLKKSAEVTPI